MPLSLLFLNKKIRYSLIILRVCVELGRHEYQNRQMRHIWNKESVTSSIQFLPTPILNNSLVPTVESNKSFKYLGRYFNLHMDNNDHMSTLLSTSKDLMIKTGCLPRHPKYKLLLYHRFALSTLPDLSCPCVLLLVLSS